MVQRFPASSHNAVAREQIKSSYFPAQNSTPLAFGENRPAGGKLQGRTELNLTSVVAADSFL
jgi:hypothetical protein